MFEKKSQKDIQELLKML